MERKLIVLIIIISLIGTAVLPVNGLKSKKENETIKISEIENFIDFFSDDYDINKKYISEVCEVSEVTITKCFKKLQKHKELLIDKL